MKTIIFYAIPKTGGSNLHMLILRNNYAKVNKQIKYRGVPVTWNDSICNRGLSESIWINGECLYTAGHEEYKAIFEFENREMIFMLRNPIERVISHYAMIRRGQKAKQWTWEATQGIDCNSVELETIYGNPQLYLHGGKFEDDYIKNSEYLCGHSCYYHDFYLRMLSPYPGIMPRNDPGYKNELCTEIIRSIKDDKLFFTSKGNLQSSVNIIFGITEYYNESMNLFRHSLGLNLPSIDFTWARKYPLTDGLAEQIVNHNKYDMMIYEAAKSKFLNVVKDIPLDQDVKVIKQSFITCSTYPDPKPGQVQKIPTIKLKVELKVEPKVESKVEVEQKYLVDNAIILTSKSKDKKGFLTNKKKSHK